jgi:hypothetical protein
MSKKKFKISFYRRKKNAENPDTTEDFQYQFLKVKFDLTLSETIKYTFQKFTNKFEIEFRKD